jgi:hypothetical protein
MLAVAGGFVLFRAIPVLNTYFLYRGKRLLHCPDTLNTEAVDVAGRTAAASAFLGELRFVWIDVRTGQNARIVARRPQTDRS